MQAGAGTNQSDCCRLAVGSTLSLSLSIGGHPCSLIDGMVPHGATHGDIPAIFKTRPDLMLAMPLGKSWFRCLNNHFSSGSTAIFQRIIHNPEFIGFWHHGC
jgi:hypothetical protein